MPHITKNDHICVRDGYILMHKDLIYTVKMFIYSLCKSLRHVSIFTQKCFVLSWLFIYFPEVFQ